MQHYLSDLIKFINHSPTPYHAVKEASKRLIKAGFLPLSKDSVFELDWNQGYFIIEDGNLHAFITPHSRDISGFRLLAAHTDSPNLRLKPNPEIQKEGYYQLGVDVYGEPILNSWFDRDLSLAGRIFIQDSNHDVRSELICFERPLLRIPQLAIHLERELPTKGFIINRQEHINPIGGIKIPLDTSTLHQLCAAELNCNSDDIVHMELMLFDTTPPTQIGILGEFISSSRLDNLAMCHASISAILETNKGDQIPWVCLFDHEEVGSQSRQGAASRTVDRLLHRVLRALEITEEARDICIVDSACISMDMAHGLHPNYVEKYDRLRSPMINNGPVFKMNPSRRYANDGYLLSQVQSICDRLEIPYQWYSHRSDLPCGSTVGPIVETKLGIKTIDIGNTMLGMHSIREMAGVIDHGYIIKVAQNFLQEPYINR